MNVLDYLVLVGVIVGIAAYGMWRTRARADLHTYLKGPGHTHWLTIGLSVMATQASAITFLSTPGQGYESGLGFVQNYFGAPLALIIIAAVFLPIYRRLNVYTAYEFLGNRFDAKTRLLGAALFLVQRGLDHVARAVDDGEQDLVGRAAGPGAAAGVRGSEAGSERSCQAASAASTAA